MARITCDALDKHYPDGFHAVKALDLEVAEGEFLVLVGPSGCGKSTALRMIAGLEAITGGELRFDGERVNEQSPQQRNIAMVFQSYALYPHKSVRENIAFPLRMQRWPRADRDAAIARVATMLDLGELLDRRPAALSGGQRQRVAMARALVRDPTAFLLDEPLSNLDAKLRVQMRSEILSLQRRSKTTTIYVTHDQVEAMTMGDRVAVLSRGVLQQVDEPQVLYRRPVNIFVAGFIGSPSMNLLRATVTGQDLLIGDHRVPVPDAVWQRFGGAGGLDGRTLTAGLRPEAFRPVADQQAAIPLTVRVVERLGHEVLVHADHPTEQVDSENGQAMPPEQARIVVRLPAREALHLGDTLPVSIDPDDLHLFAEDGATLAVDAAAAAAAAGASA